MHVRIEDLLALADGDAAPEVIEHVRDCAQCGAERDRVAQLRAALVDLPEEIAPAPDARLFASTPAAVPQPRRWQRPILALAATVLVATVAGLLVWDRPGAAPTQTAGADTTSQRSDTARASRGALTSRSVGPRVTGSVSSAELQRRSAQLENQWRVLNQRSSRVQRVGFAARTAALTTRVQQLDAGFDRLPEDRYWQRRVELMDALVTLERAERLARVRPGVDSRRRADGPESPPRQRPTI